MRIVWVSAHDREIAAAALARSEDRFRRLLVNAADAVVVLDAAGTIVFATEAIETLTGYAVDELVGRRDASVIVRTRGSRARRATATTARCSASPGRSLRADMRVQHRDGSLRWCQISVTNQLDDPVIEGIVVNVHDITERREAEASVAAAEARFRTLVQHAADGIIILDADARCQYVSPSYERLTGQHASSARRQLRAPVRAPRRRRPDRRRVGAHARASRRRRRARSCACGTPTGAGTGRRARSRTGSTIRRSTGSSSTSATSPSARRSTTSSPRSRGSSR